MIYNIYINKQQKRKERMKKKEIVSIEFLDGKVNHKSIVESANFQVGRIIFTGADGATYYGNLALDYLKIFDRIYNQIMNKNNLDDDEIKNEFLSESKKYLADWNACIDEYIDKIEENGLDVSKFEPLNFYDLLGFFIDRGHNIHNLEKEIET
jgi:hypothetical protein